MIKNIFIALFARRHFWRRITFSEMSELYASRMLRMAAMNMAGAFMSIYLYQIGYSVGLIAFFWAAFFLYRVLISLPVAAMVAHIGPKHGILVSNLSYIPAMIGFALLPVFGPWLFIPILIFEGFSASSYSIAYTVDFSKVKSLEHVGKQIAFMNILEKITTSVSPLIGGLLAFMFGPQLVLVVAAVLFSVAAVPLFHSGEPVKTGLKLEFKGFPWKLVRRHWLAQTAVGFDIFTSGTVWMLFTAVLIVGFDSGNKIYVVTGMLLSAVLLAALAASYTYGKIIDKKGGRALMRAGVVAKSFTHFIRPFVTSIIPVAGMNVANEISTTGYAMPYTRAIFDNADLSGHRATYLGIIDMISTFGAFLAALTLALLAMAMGDTFALTNFFFIAAVVVLLILTARFSIYKK